MCGLVLVPASYGYSPAFCTFPSIFSPFPHLGSHAAPCLLRLLACQPLSVLSQFGVQNTDLDLPICPVHRGQALPLTPLGIECLTLLPLIFLSSKIGEPILI